MQCGSRVNTIGTIHYNGGGDRRATRGRRLDEPLIANLRMWNHLPPLSNKSRTKEPSRARTTGPGYLPYTIARTKVFNSSVTQQPPLESNSAVNSVLGTFLAVLKSSGTGAERLAHVLNRRTDDRRTILNGRILLIGPVHLRAQAHKRIVQRLHEARARFVRAKIDPKRRVDGRRLGPTGRERQPLCRPSECRA
jgi:hypothetical protein